MGGAATCAGHDAERRTPAKRNQARAQATQEQTMIHWITIAKFAMETGYSEKAVRRKIEDHKWPDSLWTKAPDGHILINVEEYESWVSNTKEFARGVTRSKSTSASKASGAGRLSSLSPRRPI
ncbi:hypothetical protein BPC006_II0509 [Burkholderia pseudomallei BPC006]|nr:hypothetical protein BPC006_II0509 [Burkholderia pseudomallei BPC006]